MANRIYSILIELGICDSGSCTQIHDRVRDSNDIQVNRCEKSGVIFLSKSDHIDSKYYKEMSEYDYWETQDRNSEVISGMEDLDRRSEELKYIVANKKWLDVGTGVGGILDRLAKYTKQTYAVEPQSGARESLKALGYSAYSSVEEVPCDDIQVVTLFHVFEHMTDPLSSLIEIQAKMEPGGRIVIEVPHAKDFLISFLNNNAFKSFTFWSEHLILHTRKSLQIFLEKAGFTDVSVSGYQRYPVANHLRWLAKEKPGGHLDWSMLRSRILDDEYENMLAKIDCNDTLVATAFKENRT